MKKYLRQGIEYIGVSDDIPDNVNLFKDDFLEEIIDINNEKQEIKKIIKCCARAGVENARVIKVLGNETYNYKCVVTGEINARSEYISNIDDSIYSDKTTIRFSIDIDMINNFIKNKKIIGSVFIEDIFIEKLSIRKYILSFAIIAIIE